MANTTIGLDIGARALRYALCNSDGAKAEITAFGTIPVHPQPGSVSALNWDAAYAEMAEIMAPYRKIPLEGIGMCVDPTRALTLHKLMPFNDPRILGQVLPQALTDTWNVDDDTQIAFEVGGFVKGVQTDPDDESSVEGYDIHVVNYPKGILREEIEKLDSCVETTKENELYLLQKRVEGNVPIVKPARKFITKVCSLAPSDPQGYFACIVPTKREIKDVMVNGRVDRRI